MKLTGKCKEDFKEWMLVNNKELVKFSEERYSEVIDMSQIFKYLTDSMQYGVLEDFFQVKGFYFDYCVGRNTGDETDILFMIDIKNKIDLKILCTIEEKSTPEARTKAIEKANETYNYEKTKE